MKVGFKTTAYKDANYQVAVVENQEPRTENQDRTAILQQLGFEKAHRVLLAYLTGSKTAGLMIQDLNEIRRHFFIEP